MRYCNVVVFAFGALLGKVFSYIRRYIEYCLFLLDLPNFLIF